jgi:hypothetical protein
MEHGRQGTRTTRRVRLVAGLVALAVAAGLAPLGAPAGAAPPAVTHPGLVNPDPINNTPHILDDDDPRTRPLRPEAVLDLGTRVIVGGNFLEVAQADAPTRVLSRPYIFAYTKATGAIDPTFRPALDGKVTSLLRAPDGKVVVGGQFKRVDGRDMPYLVKLDPTSGAPVTGWVPRPTGMVYDLHLVGNLLYLGGTFAKVGSANRANFAVIDVATGGVRGNDVGFTGAVQGISRVMRFDMSPDGRKLVAIGNFTRVGGQTRPNAAVLDVAANGTATTTAWRTNGYQHDTCGARSSYETFTYDVDMSPDGSYFVIVTTGGAGGTRLCDTAARWDTNGTGAAPRWINYTGGDSLTSVAITGAAVYVGGHQRWLDNPRGSDSAGPGAVSRPGIGALSPSTGKALSWNPGKTRGQVSPRLVPTAEGLYVLSDTELFAGERRPKLAYLTLTGRLPTTPPPTDGKPTAPGAPTVTAATASSATLTWGAATADRAVSYTVVARAGTTTVATVDVGTARSATVGGLPAGRVVTFTVTPRTTGGTGPAAATAPALPPFATVDAFTTRQFRDLVGRAPSAGELDDWRTRVGGGTVTPQAAIDQLMGGSSVGRLGSVVRLYTAYYQRAPEIGGFRYWRDQARSGVSTDAISQKFAVTPEFRTLYGRLDDGGFVDLVYRNVLGRSPDAAGKRYWVDQLRRGVTRGKVMTGFSESPENKTATRGVTDAVLVFSLMLDRAPSGSERGWTGTRAEQVRQVLVSAAYDQRV